MKHLRRMSCRARARFGWLGSLALVVVCIAVAPAALASPMGDAYNVAGVNFPNDYGPVNATFDGQAKVVGGMRLVDQSTPFAGVAGGRVVTDIDGGVHALPSWASRGEVLEFTFDTDSGTFVSNERGVGRPSQFIITELDWPSVSAPPVVYTDGWYMSFRTSGVHLAPEFNANFVDANDGVFIGPHPFNEGEDVVYVQFSQEQLDAIATTRVGGLDLDFSTETFGFNAGLFELALALGALDQENPFSRLNDIDGVRFGVLVGTPIPGDTFPFDGVVDLGDLNRVRNNFGGAGSPVAGDTNNDGMIDLADLNNVRNNFGAGVLEAPAAVPEPSAWLLAALGAALLAGGARRYTGWSLV